MVEFCRFGLNFYYMYGTDVRQNKRTRATKERAYKRLQDFRRGGAAARQKYPTYRGNF